LISIKGKEDMKTRWRIFTISQRVDSSEKNVGIFLITRHDDHNLWSRILIEDMLDALGPSNRVGDELIYADEPRYDQKSRKRPEREPLQEADHFLRKVSGDLTGKWECYDHDRQEYTSIQWSARVNSSIFTSKTYLRPVKANIITIARILMLSVSAF
jgi:hypothetical protein